MSLAGYTGWVEILLIALFIMWIINAYRRNNVLKKMEEKLDRSKQIHEKPKKRTAPEGKAIDDAEDVEYLEVD